MGSSDTTISAADANRHFSKLLRAASKGARIVITSHGEPVAEIGPVSGEFGERIARQAKAQAGLEARWANCETRTVGAWTREELYDRD